MQKPLSSLLMAFHFLGQPPRRWHNLGKKNMTERKTFVWPHWELQRGGRLQRRLRHEEVCLQNWEQGLRGTAPCPATSTEKSLETSAGFGAASLSASLSRVGQIFGRALGECQISRTWLFRGVSGTWHWGELRAQPLLLPFPSPAESCGAALGDTDLTLIAPLTKERIRRQIFQPASWLGNAA